MLNLKGVVQNVHRLCLVLLLSFIEMNKLQYFTQPVGDVVLFPEETSHVFLILETPLGF